MTIPDQDDFWGPVISEYSRAQAIEDGVLLDVSPIAYMVGFKYSVAVTRAVWIEYVKVPDGIVDQDENGRLWDVLWMLKCGMRNAQGDTVLYKLHVRKDNSERTPPLVTLKAICGPGDTPEPVITIMLPEED